MYGGQPRDIFLRHRPRFRGVSHEQGCAGPSEAKVGPRRCFVTNRDDVKTLKQRVQAEVDRLAPDLFALSRFLHANPEIAYEEYKAAGRLTAILEADGGTVMRRPSVVTASWMTTASVFFGITAPVMTRTH